MKTKDLCQLFDLPRSAVRFYRNASLFSLQQDENGYFHYEVEEIAALAGTFNYEFVCDLGKRIPRVYEYKGKIVGNKDYFTE